MRDAISTRSRAISIWYPRRLSFKTRIVRSIRNTRSTRITRRIDRFTYRREGWERKESEKRANRERIESPQKQKGIREVNILFPYMFSPTFPPMPPFSTTFHTSQHQRRPCSFSHAPCRIV